MLLAKFDWYWHSGSGEKDAKSLQQRQQQRQIMDKISKLFLFFKLKA